MIYRTAFLVFIISLILFLKISAPHDVSEKNNITDNKEARELMVPKKEEKVTKIRKDDQYAIVNNAIAKSFTFFDENNYNKSEKDYR
ncbi:MAG: hypothetical protein C0601_08020 [Candidatus Muiribacterium halophilum]|uniref:Uncharacterized protein n=1 Tax=Muiribacterium halophilum TaxID=2053465 RepID=A0A2N5ZF28_MUIH1|nr:MAG: hypothetical protein C0601_08020 [Candidatus Muirbacterium halophilum]